MMLSRGDRRRRLVRGLSLAGVAAVGYVFGTTTDRLAAQPPAALPGAVRPNAPAPAQPQPEPDRRVVAYLYGNVPVTREELGDFLIARGGHEKLELLVNKRIIEIAAAQRGITVTPVEVQAGLEEDLRGLGIDKKAFVDQVLPRYRKTLYEWVEDVIKPRLLLSKMCRENVKITDDDVRKVYENRYGERRAAQILTWNANDVKRAQKDWAEARKGDAEFDAVARTLADPNLAAAHGKVQPIGPHPADGSDPLVVKTLYKLKVGEISGIIQVPAGLMCIKYVAPVPAEADKTLDEKMIASIRKDLFAMKMDQEIPKCFLKLKEAAQPNLLLKGPPSTAEYRDGVNNLIQQAGGVPAGAAPMPVPMKP